MSEEKNKENNEKEKDGENLIKYLREKRISARGRSFKGKVIKMFPSRVTIGLERTLYIKKYERYAKKKTKLHARLHDFMKDEVNVGDFIEIRECRPLSKIIHFIVINKISGGEK